MERYPETPYVVLFFYELLVFGLMLNNLGLSSVKLYTALAYFVVEQGFSKKQPHI